MVRVVSLEPRCGSDSASPWEDLARRFHQARRAALARVQAAPGAARRPDDEAHAALELDEEAFAKLTDLLFENARQLGLGFAGRHGAIEGRQELAELLGALELPCARGTWAHAGTEAVSFLRRPRCSGPAQARCCDYWREALDGLALGLSEGRLHHRRHQSRGHGDARCVDVLLEDPQSPLRFRPLGPELRETLARVHAGVSRLAPGAEIEFLGRAEGRLYFRVLQSPEVVALVPMLERALARHRPDLTPTDVTPRSVLVGD